MKTKQWIESRGWVFILSVVLYLLGALAPNPILHFTMSLASILSLILAFFAASRTSQGLTIVFLFAGGLLVGQQHFTIAQILLSFGSMLQLLSLFSVVPILALPIQIGNYQRSVQRFVGVKILPARVMYFTIELLSYILGSLMNIAAIPMMYQSVRQLVEESNVAEEQQFLTKSIITGYAMPLIWSPVAAVVAAVVSVTRVSWVSILPISFALSLVGLGLSMALHKFTLKHTDSIPKHSDSIQEPFVNPKTNHPTSLQRLGSGNSGQKLHGLWNILLGISIFILAMTALQRTTTLSMIEIISILSIPFAWAWSLFLRQSREFWRSLKGYQKSVKNLHNTFAVFTAAGFFVEVLQHSPYIKTIDEGLVAASQQLTPAVFIAFIPVLTVLLSLIGFHPVVSITLLGAALHPQVLHVSPVWLSIALLGGGVITFIVSPFNATLNVTGTVSGESPGRLMRWNLPFVLAFLLMVMLVVGLGQSFQSSPYS